MKISDYNMWIDSELAIAMAWTLAHSLWQLALVGVLLFIVLNLTKHKSASWRFNCILFFASLIAFGSLLTFSYYYYPTTSQVWHIGTAVQSSSVPFQIQLSHFITQYSGNLTMIWVLGAAGFLLWHTSGMWLQHQLLKDAKASPNYDQVLRKLLQKAGVGAVPRIYMHEKISAPITFRHWRNIILLPASLCTYLTPAQIEALVAHELAHIVRQDYLINLLVGFMRAVYFFHPVIWWLNNALEQEREAACDDLAIQWCGDKVNYAKALVALPIMQSQIPLALSAQGQPKHLLVRVQRIFNKHFEKKYTMEKTVAFLFMIATAALFSFRSIDIQEQDQSPNTYSVIADTIPPANEHWSYSANGETIEIRREHGKITELIVDGQEINPEDHQKYQDRIQKLMEAVPPPPPLPPVPAAPSVPEAAPQPPTPPLAPDVPTAPSAPLPDALPEPPLPPAPPMPPSPPKPPVEGKHSLHAEAATYAEQLAAMERELLHQNRERQARMEFMEEEAQLRAEKLQLEQEEMAKQQQIHNNQLVMEQRALAKQIRNDQRAKVQIMQERISAQQVEQAREHHEYALKLHEAQRSLQNSQEERMEALRSKLKQSALRYHKFSPQQQADAFYDQLKQDGYLKPGGSVRIKLNKQQLKINGKKQPAEIFKRYRNLYQQLYPSDNGTLDLQYRYRHIHREI